ncbi:MAG: ATP-binding cassette domain-containing protein [Erysipelotrichaceae bacterium]
MSEYFVETKNLSKKYGHHYANEKINIHIPKGKIYGLVGRNGAGKTTFMKLVCNIINKSSGQININGKNEYANKHYAMGALIEAPALITELSAYENISLKCNLCGIKNSKEHTLELLKLVQLESTGKKPVGSFSLGMKQRVGIALALVGFPELLILDEPINGLDPQGMAQIRDLLISLKDKGMTIVISSHILSELIKVADGFGIISQGKLISEMSIDELNKKLETTTEIDVDNIEVANKLIHSKYDYKLSNNTIILKHSSTSISDIESINKALVEHGVNVSRIETIKTDIDDMFITMMGGEHYA